MADTEAAAATCMAAPPLVDDVIRLPPDHLIDEILLRIPPDDPASLAAASLVCLPWRRILSDPAFRARYRAFHGAPPLLGFLHGAPRYCSRFVSASALRPAGRDLPDWLALDCRHGLAHFASNHSRLFAAIQDGVDLVVWNPVTNVHRRLPRVPLPTDRTGYHFNAAVFFNAAVLCAAEGCDHGDCYRGGPFRVVFVFTCSTDRDTDTWETVTSARAYSSESGAWGEPTSLHHVEDRCVWVEDRPSVLVGDAIYFSCGNKYILEYQLSALPRLSLIVAPAAFFHGACVVIIKTEAGVLEFADVQGSTIEFWSRHVDGNGAADWGVCRTIELEKLLPDGALDTDVDPQWMMAHVSGFVEGTDVIFVGTSGDVYMVQLNSRRVTKVLECRRGRVIPYVSFYIPAMEAVSTGEGSREGASST